MASVGIIMGSINDNKQLTGLYEVLDELEIEYEKSVISAHRTPDRMIKYAQEAESRGIKVIIAAAGGAAHLPGMTASETDLPVIGIPIKSSALNGIDSLLSIVQMPRGVPVGTMSIGPAGAKNAGIYAAKILSLSDDSIKRSLRLYKERTREMVLDDDEDLQGD